VRAVWFWRLPVSSPRVSVSTVASRICDRVNSCRPAAMNSGNNRGHSAAVMECFFQLFPGSCQRAAKWPTGPAGVEATQSFRLRWREGAIASPDSTRTTDALRPVRFFFNHAHNGRAAACALCGNPRSRKRLRRRG
jgi:hypothetical protein